MKKCLGAAEGIKKIIKERGVSQRYVAEKVGFTQQQLCDMLNGRKVIRADYLPIIADALGVDVNDFFADGGQSGL